MRAARKLLLLGVMALAAMALTAPAAFGAIEVKTEPNLGSKHCTAVTVVRHVVSGGCRVHAVNTTNLLLTQHNHATGAEVLFTNCNNEFEAAIGENGTGAIYGVTLTDVTPGSCFLKPCIEKVTHAVEAWPVSITEVAGVERFELTYCIQPKPVETEGSPCTLHIPMTKVGHVYSLNGNGADGKGVGCEAVGDERELTGRWTLENAGEAGHMNIEIVHP